MNTISTEGFRAMMPQMPATEAAPTARAATPQADLTVQTAGVGDLRAVDAAHDVPEAALRRDDALGRLVSRAFDMPAPPRPVFT